MAINLKGLKIKFIIAQILVLFFIFKIISCQCSNGGIKSTSSLVMEVEPCNLVGESKTTTAIFRVAAVGEQVDLDKFYLKVRFVNQQGGINSRLNYQDGEGNSKIVEEITEKLTHFTKIFSLEDNNPPLKIELKVIPEEVTGLIYKIELLNEQGFSIDSAFVNWNAQKGSLVLIRESIEKIQGDEKKIKLRVHNPNPEPTEAGKLKLIITRTEGKQASIVGAIPMQNGDTSEIGLAWIANNQDLIKDLKIDPKTDLKAAFTFQLFYQGKQQDNPVTVSWEQGMLLNLSIQDKGTPRMLTYSVENNGTVCVKGVKLQYTSKTEGVKLQGKSLIKNELKEIAIGDLAVNSKKAEQILGILDFGINTSADFEFKLVYEQGNTKPRSHTFTPLDVRLGIDKLVYDPISGRVTYSIKNTGTVVAEKVQLQYTNVSEDDPEEQKAELNKKKTDTTCKINIDPNSSTDEIQRLIDFKKADKATFRFEVLYNNLIINQATITRTFKAKEVKMKILPVGVPRSEISLTGNNRTFKYKIEMESDSRPIANIDLKHLRIDIINTMGNVSFLSKSSSSRVPISSLTVAELGNGSILYVNPETAKEAEFALQLHYKDEPKGAPLKVTWKEDNLLIEDLNSFVGDNEASFVLYNTVAAIDPSQFTIELTSDKGSQFCLIKPDSKLGDSTMPLKQLIGDNQIAMDTPTRPVGFKLTKAIDSIDKDQVTVIVKRGNTELTSHKVNWKADGVSFEAGVNQGWFEDNKELGITIINKGRDVEMEEIQLQLIHEKGTQYKVGRVAGDNISTSLDKILDNKILGIKTSSNFKKGASASITLQLDTKNILDKYTANLTLELSHKGTPLYTKDLLWINKKQFVQSFNGLKEEVKKLQTEFDASKKKSAQELFNNDNYDHWNKQSGEIAVCKQKAGRIQVKATDLISKLNAKLQNKEKEQIETDIIQIARQISADADMLILDALEIVEQKISAYVEQSEIEKNASSVKKNQIMWLLANDVKGKETVVENAIQFVNRVASIGEKAKKISELLAYVSNFAESMHNQIYEERINQAKFKYELIVYNIEAAASSAMDALGSIAEKIKTEVEKFKEEVKTNKSQAEVSVDRIIQYFNDQHASFFEGIDAGIKQNIEQLFSEFEKRFTAYSMKINAAYHLINRVTIAAANFAIDTHIALNKVDVLHNLDNEIKETYKQIEQILQGTYSISTMAALVMFDKAEQEQELQKKHKQVTSGKYKSEIAQQSIQNIANIFWSISEFYRQNKNKDMQNKALAIQNAFIHNSLN